MTNEKNILACLNHAIEISNNLTKEYDEFLHKMLAEGKKVLSPEAYGYLDEFYNLYYICPFWNYETHIPAVRREEILFYNSDGVTLHPVEYLHDDLSDKSLNVIKDFILMVKKWALNMDYESLKKNFVIYLQAQDIKNEIINTLMPFCTPSQFLLDRNKHSIQQAEFIIDFFDTHRPLEKSLIKLHTTEMKLMAKEQSKLFIL